MPNRPVRDQWGYPRKMERHFPIKPGQPIGANFFLFPNSLIRAKNRFVKNGTANFGRNIPTEISGPPSEVIPNFPVGRNPYGPLHLNFDRSFQNLWHNGKRLRCTPVASRVFWREISQPSDLENEGKLSEMPNARLWQGAFLGGKYSKRLVNVQSLKPLFS